MLRTRRSVQTRRGFLWMTAALLLCLPLMGLAQSSEDELALAFPPEEMISIATGGEQALTRAPAVATVITARDIEAMGAQNLDQVLESVPGLHVSLSNIRFSPIYSIRGIYTTSNPQVLVLVNGIPITQMWIGDRGIGSYPVADISRIEIIRGPGSAVYGADAFAGVINLLTKSAKEISGTQVSALAGSFETYQGSLLYGSKDKEYWGFNVAFSIQYFDTEGDKDRIVKADAQTSLDPVAEFFTGSAASLAPGPVDTRAKWLDTRLDLKHDRLQFRIWNWQREDLGVGPGLSQALDPTGRGDANNYLVDVTYHEPRLTRDLDFKTIASYMDINSTSKQRLFPTGTVLPIGPDGNVDPTSGNFVTFTEGLIGNPAIFEEHTRVDIQLFYTGVEKHRVRFGTGMLNAKVKAEETKNFGPGVIDGTQPVVDGTLTDVSDTQYAFYTSGERDVYYLSLQDEWSVAPDWDLTAGVRYDDYSDFGNTVNPRAALVWHQAYNMSTKLLYGSAFRPPSFIELFAKNNPTAIGNPNLKPEKIETIEIALDYLPTFDLHTSINAFYYDIVDLIRFEGGVAQNTEGQEGHGLEWEVNWKISATWNLMGNYAFQKSTDKTTDSDVANSPGHQVYLENRWEFVPSWHFNTIVKWISDRNRAQSDPRPQIEDYTLVNLVLMGTQILPSLDLEFLVFNVFDENAYEPSPYDPNAVNSSQVASGAWIPGDYPLSGRSYYAGINYKF